MGGAQDGPRPAGVDLAAWDLARRILRHVPAGSISIFDRDLRYVLAEGTGLRDVGMSSEALVGKTLPELFPPADVALVTPYYRQALAGTPVSFELPVGDRIYAINAAPLHAPGFDPPVHADTCGCRGWVTRAPGSGLHSGRRARRDRAQTRRRGAARERSSAPEPHVRQRHRHPPGRRDADPRRQ